MAGPTIELFSTSILSNVKVRTRHERYTSVLAIKKIPYVYHDLASDDDAKSRWRRKAKDPQLPGLLVNNEWVGSYDEFEEAVEFGELELFLGVSPAAPQITPPAPHPAQSAVSSKDPSLYPTLPYAAEGAGRWKEPDADQFISTLNMKEDELTDADVDALLADIGKLPSAPAPTSEKKYVPSKEAAIKPLRLAKMGPTTSHQSMPSGTPSPASAGSSAGTRGSPMARYSATQRSTKALAAEAAALTSNRKTSGALLRDAVSQGKTLDDAMEESRMKHIVSQDNIDDLFASLGLSNVDIGDDEVDQFLEQGAIPQGLRLGGDRVHRPSSIADKARDEAVARDLAQKAKGKGHGSARGSLSGEGLKVAVLQAAALVASTADSPSADVSSSRVPPVTETTSEASEAEPAELSKAEDAKPSSLDAPAPTKDGGASDDASVAEPEPTEMEKTRPVEPIKTATEQPEAELASSSAESTAASNTGEPDAVTTGAAPPESTADSKTKVSLDDAQAPKEGAEDQDVKGKRDADDSIVSGRGIEATQEASTIASISSKSLSSKDDSESQPPVKQVEKEAASSSSEKKMDSSAITATAEETTVLPPIRVDSTEVQDGKLASSGDESASKSVNGAGSAQVDEDRTPTKEMAKDPIALQVSSPAPASASTTTAAAAATAKQQEQAHADASFEQELAQAAMIASRYEDHKSSAAIPKSEKAVEDSHKSVSNSADATSPVVPVPATEADTATRASTLEKAAASHAEAVQNHKQPLSVRLASSRRAIDVSRPIDPAAVSPSSAQPVPSPSSHADLSTSPDTKKKKMGIRGFGLGRDKDRDKDKDKDAASSDKKQPAAAAAAAGGSRHERTISQILREADAVLQSDDYDGEGSDGDEEEDPTMFGSSSNDTDAAAPTRALRST
ncbi:uncharacterized protein SRS1_16145 [Sporisorium reilianum f. sp. reilianum]|uniref:Uncharacterized protein n=1 Tax=Sporisorium reilianum f. sp. reilianum TaxID=72559 RepID=A0A2N8UL68_9BASI|nr:uncharacterized protein SRS1_16145 [Sporisorium reilianum f. sp. reilianum]